MRARRIATYALLVLSFLVLIGGGLAFFTIGTRFTEAQVRDWVDVAAAGLAGVGSVVAASVAVFAVLAQQRSSQFAVAAQERAAAVAVQAQLQTTRETLEHERGLAGEAARNERDRSLREALRTASAGLTATLANIDALASAVRSAEETRRDDATKRLPVLQAEARAQYEALRLLGSGETQRAGRMALRHAWALWQEAITGLDPRRDDPGEDYVGTPWERFHRELRALLISVRHDLDLEDPADVFEEPDS